MILLVRRNKGEQMLAIATLGNNNQFGYASGFRDVWS